jgi:very-short-patch-repair endonuclease
MSVPERLLWQHFRQRPGGLKFRRQHPIGPYAVDFCCLSHKLVVEIEGIAHDMGQQPEYDLRRFQFIKDNGFRVIRVSAKRVLADAAGTADAIVARAESPLHRPADGPPPRAGEAN